MQEKNEMKWRKQHHLYNIHNILCSHIDLFNFQCSSLLEVLWLCCCAVPCPSCALRAIWPQHQGPSCANPNKPYTVFLLWIWMSHHIEQLFHMSCWHKPGNETLLIIRNIIVPTVRLLNVLASKMTNDLRCALCSCLGGSVNCRPCYSSGIPARCVIWHSDQSFEADNKRSHGG